MKLMLITGANGQIGNYLARQYLQEGYRLALLYHKREDRLQDLIKMPEIFTASVDLQDMDALKLIIDEINRFFGTTPDILIHTAALRSYDAKPLYQSDPEVFKQIVDANLIAAYNLLRLLLTIMKEKGNGRVLMFGSDVTRKGLKCGAAYAAAKSAIVSLVKSCALEMAPYGIIINAISPGPVETVLEEDYSGAYLKFRQDYFSEYKKEAPTGELIRPAELKKMADLLISPDMVNLTGEEMLIRGGLQ